MIDKEGKIIYIGKAKNLSNRVKQYFQKSKNFSVKTQKLIENIADIKFIEVDSDLEAMILETNLIKQFKPKYNILMKDDKNYVYIKITKEDFPRIQIVRKIEKDNATYIGPKTAAHKVKETFKILKKIFPFRHCSLNIKSLGGERVEISNKTIKYPCLDYYIKRCIAPCIGKCTKEKYQEIIKNIENFLKGRADDILHSLNNEMQKYALRREFEKAVKIRDKIKKVKDILEKQSISDPSQEDKDIINYCIALENAYFNLFQIRDGKLINQENFILTAKEVADNTIDQEVLRSFLNQYYEISTDIPKEILIPHETQDMTETEEFINKNSNKKTNIIIPKIGTKNKLLEMSLKNAQIFADRNRQNWQMENPITENAIKELEKLLKITHPIKRIECYDISHLSGTDTVGSMVVFTKGIPDKKMYRKFRLRTVLDKPDDYKSMEEVLTRRFNYLSEYIKFQNYIFKKARNKDIPFIEKHNRIDVKKSKRNFYILEKTSSPIGFIAVNEHTKTISELTNLWIKKEERGNRLGYKLIKNAINKTKSKRVYILCKAKLEEYYLLFGFEKIKTLPKELEKRCKECKCRYKENPVCMVYDKTKHKEDASFKSVPDLIILDGGKGQLSVGIDMLKKFHLQIPLMSLAKKLEEIFVPNKSKSILLENNNETLNLLKRIRNEAHRFAIEYNKNLREKKYRLIK